MATHALVSRQRAFEGSPGGDGRRDSTFSACQWLSSLALVLHTGAEYGPILLLWTIPQPPPSPRRGFNTTWLPARNNRWSNGELACWFGFKGSRALHPQQYTISGRGTTSPLAERRPGLRLGRPGAPFRRCVQLRGPQPQTDMTVPQKQRTRAPYAHSISSTSASDVQVVY